MMPKLRELIEEFDANAFVFCDRGQGCGFGANGVATDYDEERAAEYGEVELAELPEPVMSEDGMECNYSSEWFASEGWPGHEWRLMF